MMMISPADCADNNSCTTSPNFSNKRVYANCSVLPVLNATFYWTHVPATSSLSFSLAATLSNLSEWVGFGVNPTGTGMPGAEAIVAFKSNGFLIAKQYMLYTYRNVTQRNLTTIGVKELAAETNGNGTVMILSATLSLPTTETAELNYIWQVGEVSGNGVPLPHAFAPENLEAKGTLALTKSATTTSGTTTNGTTPTSGGGGGSGAGKDVVSFGLLVLLLGNFIMGF